MNENQNKIMLDGQVMQEPKKKKDYRVLFLYHFFVGSIIWTGYNVNNDVDF